MWSQTVRFLHEEIKDTSSMCLDVQAEEQSPSTEQVREFVTAAHWNLLKVKEMLAANPRLLNASYEWNENDSETAIQAAAQLGSAQVAEFLLEKGAPLEICTAAMLGRTDEVHRGLETDSKIASAVGAHGIPLLPHAVWSGNLELVQFVHKKGATSGANLALHNAVMRGNYEIVQWLIGNTRLDVDAKNYEGKTPLALARERKDARIVQLLIEHGATH